MAGGWTLIGREGKRKVIRQQSWFDRNAHLLGLAAWMALGILSAIWLGAFEVVG